MNWVLCPILGCLWSVCSFFGVWLDSNSLTCYFWLAGRLIEWWTWQCLAWLIEGQVSDERHNSKAIDLFCGYGEEPIRIVGFSILLIFICAILYSLTGLNYHGEFYIFDVNAPLSQNIHWFFSCLYYSIVTFTTLGYGDFTPIGVSRAIAAFEAFTGSFTIALFVVVFVKKMTR